jgi:hypothetical protein
MKELRKSQPSTNSWEHLHSAPWLRPPRTGPSDNSITPPSPRCAFTACLFSSSFMSGLWGLYFLGLGWHWLLLWFFTGGRHNQFLPIPPLIFPYSRTGLGLKKLCARLLPPSQRPSAPVLLPPLFFFLLPLLYLHQLFKAFGCCWVYNEPILER